MRARAKERERRDERRRWGSRRARETLVKAPLIIATRSRVYQAVYKYDLCPVETRARGFHGATCAATVKEKSESVGAIGSRAATVLLLLSAKIRPAKVLSRCAPTGDITRLVAARFREEEQRSGGEIVPRRESRINREKKIAHPERARSAAIVGRGRVEVNRYPSRSRI